MQGQCFADNWYKNDLFIWKADNYREREMRSFIFSLIPQMAVAGSAGPGCSLCLLCCCLKPSDSCPDSL